MATDLFVLRCRGHVNIRATHAKTLELTADEAITEAGTCIIGVDCQVDEEALLKLRGAIRVRLSCGGAEDVLTARINPFYRRGDPLIFRRNPDPGPRTFAVAASKGAAMLDRELVAALKRVDADLIVEIEQLAEEGEAGGALFVVGTPIGNEADISGRALDTLQSVDLVAAEDTRTIKAFLDRHGIRCRTVSFHDHNERQRTPQVIEKLLAGDRVALVSEAGMPLVSDPGFNLVRAAHESGIPVTVVPGPDAVTSALSVSGIAPNDFRFIGFLPRKSGARQKLFADLKAVSYTTVFFEAPHRILETLADLRAVLGDRDVVVCKNLTKPGEEIIRGEPEHVADRMAANGQPRGELAIVVSGLPSTGDEDARPELAPDLETMVESLLSDGVPTKTIAAAMAKATDMNKRDAYEFVIAMK